MLEPQTLLNDRYLIVRRLAEGGMGAVYEATDGRLGDSIVAVKETFFGTEQLRDAFRREATLLASLSHPALPKVRDQFAIPTGQFLVMEFVHGEDLATLMTKNGGPFALRDVLGWADQLLDALDYLHTYQPPIIHRDIKPQNIKLTPRGQIVLLDFGLAKGGATSIIGCTPAFAPLEQIQGRGTEPASDLYSLAATLYFLLTGTQPADSLNRLEEKANGRPDPLRKPHEINPQVPADVSNVIVQAMHLDRGQRPVSAVAFRRALRQSSQSTTFTATGVYVMPKPPSAPGAYPPTNAPLGAPPPNPHAGGDYTPTRVNPGTQLGSAPSSGGYTPTMFTPAVQAPTPTITPVAAMASAPQPAPATAPRPASPVVPLATAAARADAEARRGAKRWMLVGAAVVVLLAGAGAYEALRPQKPEGQPDLPSASVAPTRSSELVGPIGVRLEASTLATTSDQQHGAFTFAPGTTFRFRFKATTNGYLYIVKPNVMTGALSAELTATPAASDGVTTNAIRAGETYAYPGGDTRLTLDAPCVFTVVFSASPLSTPAFLAGPAHTSLSTADADVWKEFRGAAGKIAMKPGPEPMAILVEATGPSTSAGPVVFDIALDRTPTEAAPPPAPAESRQPSERHAQPSAENASRHVQPHNAEPHTANTNKVRIYKLPE